MKTLKLLKNLPHGYEPVQSMDLFGLLCRILKLLPHIFGDFLMPSLLIVKLIPFLL